MKITWTASLLVPVFAALPWPVLAQTAAPPTPAPAAASQPAPQLAAPADAHVYLIAPPNGARIRGPVLVQFGLHNMGVTQAGSAATNAGHHHLLVDVTEPVDPHDTIPADKNHLHFGAGQTETRLDLAPGRHSLQLVLGDGSHRPFVPLLASQKIQITVLPPQAPHVMKMRKKRLHRRLRYYSR